MPNFWPDDIFLIRHAESIGNVARVHALASGAETIPVEEDDKLVGLSALGIEQARALGAWFAPNPPSVVWTSPYRRARETACIAAEAWRRPVPVVTDQRLRERSLGVLHRLTAAGVRTRHPREALSLVRQGKFAYRPPAGESWGDVAQRLSGVVDALHACAHKRVAIVTHQVVVLCLRYLLESLTVEELMAIDMKSDVPNCAITHYRSTPNGLALVAYNDVSPLALLGAPITTHNDATDIG